MGTTTDAENLDYRVWDVDESVGVPLPGDDEVLAPRQFQVRVRHPEWSTEMSLQVVVDPERGPIAAGLTAFRPTAQFRQATDVPSYRQLDELLTSVIDLNVLLQRATAEAVGVFYRHRAEGTLVDDPSQVHDGEFSQAQENPRDLGDRMTAVAFPRSRPHRRRLITKEHLQNVAETYRLALQRGLAPTKHVAETFTVSHSTAARWVHLARKAGALGPATGKRPGEAVSGD